MLAFVVGLFYGCSSVEQPQKEISMLESIESFEESYKEGKIKRLLDPNREVLVNLDEFFALSKEERKIEAKKIEKRLEKAKKKFWGRAGIKFNKNDSDEKKSENTTDTTLGKMAKAMPPEIAAKILNGREKAKKEARETQKNGIKEKKVINNAMIDLGVTPPPLKTQENNYEKKLMELFIYVIPDDEKMKYRLKENRMLLLQYSPIISKKEKEELYKNLYNKRNIKIAKKINNNEHITIEENNFLKESIMKYKNDLLFLVLNKSFSDIEKMSNHSLKMIQQIINDKNYNFPKELIFYAIQKDNLELVKLLVENKKTDLNITMRMKEADVTPIQYAYKLNYKHIVDYLKQKI